MRGAAIVVRRQVDFTSSSRLLTVCPSGAAGSGEVDHLRSLPFSWSIVIIISVNGRTARGVLRGAAVADNGMVNTSGPDDDNPMLCNAAGTPLLLPVEAFPQLDRGRPSSRGGSDAEVDVDVVSS